MNWNKNASFTICVLSVMFLGMAACKKYLDASPNKQLTTPQTEQDLRAILDGNTTLNTNFSPYGAIASDDYYVSDQNYESLLDPPASDYYIWGLNGEPTDNYSDWQANYKVIFYANVVLDNVDKVALNGVSQNDLNTVKGEALFYRAFTHFQLSQIYALPYNPASASATPGVPLRLTSDINAKVTRPSLQDEFNSITTDLKLAASLLPNSSITKLRPCRPAAYAALANVYLVMQDFKNAQDMADSALNINDSLMDYNAVAANLPVPFALFNPEVLWEADIAYSSILYTSAMAMTDSALYASYAKNDLRKYLYFDSSDGVEMFKGHYNGEYLGSETYFSGFAVDELYLIKAEAAARTGDVSTAMTALNMLAKKRFSSNNFTPFSVTDKNSAIRIILDMRRKELCFRGMSRWIDIRRLNQLNGEQITLNRTLLGKTYQLAPQDLHYAFLIPQTVIDNSHIPQNER